MIRSRFLRILFRIEKMSKGGLNGFGKILDMAGVWVIYYKTIAFSLLSIDGIIKVVSYLHRTALPALLVLPRSSNLCIIHLNVNDTQKEGVAGEQGRVPL